MAYVEYVCVWYDPEGSVHNTRCQIDAVSGKPIGFPENSQLVTIVEHPSGYEPTFYGPDTTTEQGLENEFP